MSLRDYCLPVAANGGYTHVLQRRECNDYLLHYKVEKYNVYLLYTLVLCGVTL